MRKHDIGDTVYVAQYRWPTGVVRYKVIATIDSYTSPLAYELRSDEGSNLTRYYWCYEVFGQVDAAFNYRYEERFYEEELRISQQRSR